MLDATTNTVLAQQAYFPKKWQSYSITFTSPKAAGHNLVLELSNYQWNVAGGSASFARIEMQQQAEYLTHDSVIVAPMAEFVPT